MRARIRTVKHLKSARTDPARFRRTTRVNPKIKEMAASFMGSERHKVEQIAKKVLEQIPPSNTINQVEKQRIFRRGAEVTIKQKKPIGPFHCAERCNLALALLNAAGVKSWLARVFVFIPKTKKFIFHDYVEFSHRGGVSTLVFTNNLGTSKNHVIFEGPVEASIGAVGSYVFRAVDSKQIGGIGNWEEYERYNKKLRINYLKEVEKNYRRIGLMQREGLMPPSFL